MDDELPHSVNHRWLAYELHDGLLQWLVGARLGVETAVAKLESDQPLLADHLRMALSSLELALDEGRELIGFLDTLDVIGVHLPDALRSYVNQLELEAERGDQVLEMKAVGSEWPEIQPRSAWNLKRIAQQAIRNAMQHAGPCRIVIEFGWQAESRPCLRIVDDGRGFHAESSQDPKQFGLAGIRQRCTLIGADLEIRSQPGSGTTIQVALKKPTPSSLD